MAWLIALLFIAHGAQAYIPVLAAEGPNLPIQAQFLGKGDIARAVFAELNSPADIDFYLFHLEKTEAGKVELFVPRCSQIPYYEGFQPVALLLKGEVPWPQDMEGRHAYLRQLRNAAAVVVESRYRINQRPIFRDREMKYWVGGKAETELGPGLYTVVVYHPRGASGNYVLAMQSKKHRTESVSAFTAIVLREVRRGFCSPTGFSGTLEL
jgi:hypothetical protein